MQPLSNIKWYKNMWADPPEVQDMDWRDARMYRRRI